MCVNIVLPKSKYNTWLGCIFNCCFVLNKSNYKYGERLIVKFFLNRGILVSTFLKIPINILN